MNNAEKKSLGNPTLNGEIVSDPQMYKFAVTMIQLIEELRGIDAAYADFGSGEQLPNRKDVLQASQACLIVMRKAFSHISSLMAGPDSVIFCAGNMPLPLKILGSEIATLADGIKSPLFATSAEHVGKNMQRHRMRLVRGFAVAIVILLMEKNPGPGLTLKFACERVAKTLSHSGFGEHAPSTIKDWRKDAKRQAPHTKDATILAIAADKLRSDLRAGQSYEELLSDFAVHIRMHQFE